MEPVAGRIPTDGSPVATAAVTQFFTALVLVPPALAALGVWFFRRRHLGIASRLATRALIVVGAGFAVLVVVAVHGILGTGYGEIRRRALPGAVNLARTLGQTGAATDSAAAVQQMALFRAQQPDVGPVMYWRTACGPDCLRVSADPVTLADARAWAYRMAGAEPPSLIAPLRVGGVPYFVVTSAVREARGLPIGTVAVAVDARWVHRQALQTGLLLVGLAYLLFGFTWWMTRQLVALTVAQRVHDLVGLVDLASAPAPVRQAEEADDELGMLATAVRDHVRRSVDNLREADRRLTDARALTARMESTATLAAGVAHDFNNLMAGIMANSQVLQSDVADQEAARETLETIVDCADRGGKLAQQLLAFARGGKYNPVVVDLNRLVEDVVRIEGPRGDDRVERAMRLAPGLGRVHGDPTQLSQVVSNLVRNAAEAMAGVGTITIATENVTLGEGRSASLADLPAGPYVRLTIADTGPGMTEETAARIFEPFFTTKARGRGMGLAASYGIVTHHGGQIEVSSAPGAGTAFNIYLPVTDAPLVADPERPAIADPRKRGGTVLVVDDETVLLTAATRLLERAGYGVLTAENGQTAVQLARTASGPIDVILLDMKMPVMDGPAAFDLLRAARPNAVIILCSGYELDASARALLDRGAAAFVSKPFRIEYLLFEIEKAVAERATV